MRICFLHPSKRVLHYCIPLTSAVPWSVQASLNIDDPTLKALLEVLPEAPAMARRQCLQRCGLLDDDSLSYGYNSED